MDACLQKRSDTYWQNCQQPVDPGGIFDCTGTELTNNATLTYDSEVASGDSKTASTTITVKKTDCEEPEIPLDNCETNPGLEGCSTPEKNCITNPEMPGCQELPNTGPVEIIMAIVIIIGIGGGGYYLYRTQKNPQDCREICIWQRYAKKHARSHLFPKTKWYGIIDAS